MTTKERTRLGVGGLLIAASFAIGAGSDETMTSEPNGHVPELPPMHATPPAPVAQSAAETLPAPTGPGSTIGGDDIAAGGDAPTKEVAVRANAAPAPTPEAALLVLEGSASWYSDALAGRRTASGEPYDPAELIAAHRALPFGTRLRVTNLENERSVEVRVIDRGPFIAGRILDLSRSAAEEIGIVRAGHGRVRVEVLEYGG